MAHISRKFYEKCQTTDTECNKSPHCCEIKRIFHIFLVDFNWKLIKRSTAVQCSLSCPIAFHFAFITVYMYSVYLARWIQIACKRWWSYNYFDKSFQPYLHIRRFYKLSRSNNVCSVCVKWWGIKTNSIFAKNDKLLAAATVVTATSKNTLKYETWNI